MATGGEQSAAASGPGPLQSVSTQLDSLLVQLLLDLEQLEGKRVTLNARVEEGWFSLSKTRYALGAKAVSPLQYSSCMAPFFRVCTSEPETGRPEFEVIFARPGSPKDVRAQEAQGVSDYEEAESESAVLRRRPQPQGSALQTTPPTPAAATSPERDPLTWFGILVPQSLRQAQGSFRAALLMAGEIAALQSRIEWGRAQIQALLQEKQKLLDQLKVV
ncbi:coiled-coil domain-containing protein 115 [Vombatus ursinus]|uniref:coiled-coil domain-containing protein 115 n=1 Tax=Vombatus ursinus TaxID=29139 RepID=UPI000FFDA7C9|nr:coiled-coil domain-containing protein 115 [Vombatus ursinus]